MGDLLHYTITMGWGKGGDAVPQDCCIPPLQQHTQPAPEDCFYQRYHCNSKQLMQHNVITSPTQLNTTHANQPNSRPYIIKLNCLHMRRCQIRVQFESGARKKFLAPLFQPMTSMSDYQSVPWSHSFQKMYNTHMCKRHLIQYDRLELE